MRAAFGRTEILRKVMRSSILSLAATSAFMFLLLREVAGEYLAAGPLPVLQAQGAVSAAAPQHQWQQQLQPEAAAQQPRSYKSAMLSLRSAALVLRFYCHFLPAVTSALLFEKRK